MALLYPPRPGTVVMCDFAGYVEPEMVKKRRAVVVSEYRPFKHPDDATVIVVPLSEVVPIVTLPWHHAIPGGRYPGLRECWAKGDLVAHVALVRLGRIYYRGQWISPVVVPYDLRAIRVAVGAAIGLR
jgi:uncharacterized protein YifN (PemK superfamily)